MSESQPINLATVIELFGGNQVDALNLVQQFLNTLDEECQPIQSAYDAEQQEDFVRAVHRLAGATAYVGANDLLDLARQLEAETKARGLAQVAVLYQAFLAEVERVKAFEITR